MCRTIKKTSSAEGLWQWTMAGSDAERTRARERRQTAGRQEDEEQEEDDEQILIVFFPLAKYPQLSPDKSEFTRPLVLHKWAIYHCPSWVAAAAAADHYLHTDTLLTARHIRLHVFYSLAERAQLLIIPSTFLTFSARFGVEIADNHKTQELKSSDYFDILWMKAFIKPAICLCKWVHFNYDAINSVQSS